MCQIGVCIALEGAVVFVVFRCRDLLVVALCVCDHVHENDGAALQKLIPSHADQIFQALHNQCGEIGLDWMATRWRLLR